MSNRRNGIVLAVISVLALAGVVALFTSSDPEAPGAGAVEENETASAQASLGDVAGLELDGFDVSKPVSLASFRGKPLVLNYWASWCLFCIEEMPDFQAVYEDVREDVEFLGVNMQDEPSHAKDLLEITKVSYPLASDTDGKVYRTLKGFSMPTTVFIDERGEIVERFSGPLDAEQLRNRITKHFDV